MTPPDSRIREMMLKVMELLLGKTTRKWENQDLDPDGWLYSPCPKAHHITRPASQGQLKLFHVTANASI